MTDEIVQEVHEARKKVWEQNDCNFNKLVEKLIEHQEKHPERLVRNVPKTEPEPSPT